MAKKLRFPGIALFLLLVAQGPLAAQDGLGSIRITLEDKNRSLGQCLEEIALQSGFDFTYDASLVPVKQKIRFNAEDEALDLVLQRLLKNLGLDHRLIGRNIVIFPPLPVPALSEADSASVPVLRGRVIDARNGKPLDYATVALFGTSMGTVSNQEGYFAFKFPTQLPDPFLVVSYLGYKSQVIPVNHTPDSLLEIRMEKELISLQEVIIRYTDPVKLMEEALKRIPRNYLDEPSAMTAYYREAIKRDMRCMLYFESVLDVDKSAYNRPGMQDHVGIRKGRKVSDTMAEDTVIIKLRSGVFTALSLDVVKSRPDFLSDQFLDLYNLEFTDLISHKGKLVYVVTFKQKEHIEDLLLEGKLFLEQENLAIVAADFEYDPERIRKHADLFLVSSSPRIRIWPTRASYHVEYRELDGRYHMSQVRGEVGIRVRKRRKWMGANYLISFEMAISHVEPGKQIKIERPDRLKPGKVLMDQPFDFDPDFWGPLNTIEPEASLVESIQKIEHLLQEISE